MNKIGKRIGVIVLVIFVFLFHIESAVAAGYSNNQIVYITETGNKYHAYDCQYLHSSCISMPLEIAQEKGYIMCSVCKGEAHSSKSIPQTPTVTQAAFQEKEDNKGIILFLGIGIIIISVMVWGIGLWSDIKKSREEKGDKMNDKK